MKDRQPQPTAVALIRQTNDGLAATGAFTRFSAAFTCPDARPGDLYEITPGRNPKPLRRIGRPSSAPAVIEALAVHAGERDFTGRQERHARQLAEAGECCKRRDLRDLPTFTIDGDSTRDFDDALSARREGENIRVWVHVADVAAYVRPGSALDREARRRATSIYLPTRTVPMLPEALSTGVCSLLPGADRAAVTCELLLADGEVIAERFYRSLIRSDARLTYTHVDDIFTGRAEPGPTYAAALAAARQAAVDREADSSQRSDEAVFEFDGDEVCAISARRQREAHRLIERLMVLANQQVAAFLACRGVPTLYRTHARCEPQRLSRTLQRLRSLGVHPRQPTLQCAAEAVDAYEAAHGPADAVRSLLWGARPPAAYARELAAHEGLGLEAYCHFTSPIRRYADLVVHRALLAELGAEPADSAPRYVQLPDLAEHLNERNRVARKLERRAGDICRVSLLRRRLRNGETARTLAGTVVGMSEAGCFVSVDCAEGLLGARTLGGQPNAQHTVWRSQHGPLRLGDTVGVRIEALDPVRGHLRLAMTAPAPASARAQALPMPMAAPVTRAVRPARSFSVMVIFPRIAVRVFP